MKNILLIILTAIILAVAGFGKYVEYTIKKTATSVYQDRLVPQPYLSRKFDYYGSAIQDQIKVIKGGKIDLKSIAEEKAITDTMWTAYLKTYQTPEEKEVSDKAQEYIDDADSYFEEITEDGIVSDKEAKEMDAKIYPVLEYVNDLIDIQTTIGARDTKEMISLLDKFSTFMVGSIALAVVLLGSIIYDMFKNRQQPVKKPVRRTATRTTTVRKPAPRKKEV
jgi:methyl-accepting chemotaxis protein